MATATEGALVFSFVILMVVGGVSSDFAQDKKLCQKQLLSLSSCLGFVTGDAKAPSPTCCTELRKDIANNTLCLCILVRDRNEPGLGFKLNGTLALRLPSFCHIKSNPTRCPDLLHLAPNSPDAQIFRQFDGNSSAGGLGTSSSGKLSVFGRGTLRMAAGVLFMHWLVLSVFVKCI